MYQRPVAHASFERMVIVDHTLETHFSLNAADVDERQLLLDVSDFYDLTRKSKTQCLLLIGDMTCCRDRGLAQRQPAVVAWNLRMSETTQPFGFN